MYAGARHLNVAPAGDATEAIATGERIEVVCSRLIRFDDSLWLGKQTTDLMPLGTNAAVPHAPVARKSKRNHLSVYRMYLRVRGGH